MASGQLHEKKEELSTKVVDAHRAYLSLIEEIEAVDWYSQRADVTEDEELKRILVHNKNEEIEHACMMMEWLRRNQPGWSDKMHTYLFTQREIVQVEQNEDESENDLNIGQNKK
ncbi:MAG: hypothetical protein P8Y99_16390 [Calditrichaceae bacterium]